MITYRYKQAGSTLLGLILGLIVGLSIAVVVAVAVTKTPVPFVNKQGKADKLADPIATQADPNKPLYGNKAPAKEAAKEFASAPADPTVADTAPEQKPDPKPVVAKPDPVKPVVKDETKPPPPVAEKPKKADKIDKAEPKDNDTAKADKTDSPDEKWIYFLQAGAFREQADAESSKAKLALLGFETRVSERQSDSGTLYRVRIGPFSQMESMNRVRSKLSDNGVDVAVVRTAK